MCSSDLLAIGLAIVLAVATGNPTQINLGDGCDGSGHGDMVDGICHVVGGGYICVGGQLFSSSNFEGEVKIMDATIDLSGCTDMLGSLGVAANELFVQSNYWSGEAPCAIRAALGDDVIPFVPYCKDAMCTHYGNDDCKLSQYGSDSALPGALTHHVERDEVVTKPSFTFDTTDGFVIEVETMDTDSLQNSPALQIFRVGGTSLCGDRVGGARSSTFTALDSGVEPSLSAADAAVTAFFENAADNVQGTGGASHNAFWMKSHANFSAAAARDGAAVIEGAIEPSKFDWARTVSGSNAVWRFKSTAHDILNSGVLDSAVTYTDTDYLGQAVKIQTVFVDVFHVHPVMGATDNIGDLTNGGGFATCSSKTFTVRTFVDFNMVIATEYSSETPSSELLIDSFDWTAMSGGTADFVLEGRILFEDIPSSSIDGRGAFTDIRVESFEMVNSCPGVTVSAPSYQGTPFVADGSATHSHESKFTITLANQVPGKLGTLLAAIGTCSFDIKATKLSYIGGEQTSGGGTRVVIYEGSHQDTQATATYSINVDAVDIAAPGQNARDSEEYDEVESVAEYVTLVCKRVGGSDSSENLCASGAAAAAVQLGEQIKVSWTAGVTQYNSFDGGDGIIVGGGDWTTSSVDPGPDDPTRGKVTLNSDCDLSTDDLTGSNIGLGDFTITAKQVGTITLTWDVSFSHCTRQGQGRRLLAVEDPVLGNSSPMGVVQANILVCAPGDDECGANTDATKDFSSSLVAINRHIQTEPSALTYEDGEISFSTSVRDSYSSNANEHQVQIFEFGRRSTFTAGEPDELVCTAHSALQEATDVIPSGDQSNGACYLGLPGAIDFDVASMWANGQELWNQTASRSSLTGTMVKSDGTPVSGAPVVARDTPSAGSVTYTIAGDMTKIKDCGVRCVKTSYDDTLTECKMDFLVRTLTPDGYPLANFPRLLQTCDRTEYTLTRNDQINAVADFQSFSGESVGVSKIEWVGTGPYSLQVTVIYEHPTATGTPYGMRLLDDDGTGTMYIHTDKSHAIRANSAHSGGNATFSLVSASSDVSPSRPTHTRSTVVLIRHIIYEPPTGATHCGDWINEPGASATMFSFQMSPSKCSGTATSPTCVAAQFDPQNFVERIYRDVNIDIGGFASCPAIAGESDTAATRLSTDALFKDANLDVSTHFLASQSATSSASASYIRGDDVFVRMDLDLAQAALANKRQELRIRSVKAVQATDDDASCGKMNGTHSAGECTLDFWDDYAAKPMSVSRGSETYSNTAADCGAAADNQCKATATCALLLSAAAAEQHAQNILRLPTHALSGGNWTITAQLEVHSCTNLPASRRRLLALDSADASTGAAGGNTFTTSINIEIVDLVDSSDQAVALHHVVSFDTSETSFSRDGIGVEFDLTDYKAVADADSAGTAKLGVTAVAMDHAASCPDHLARGWGNTDTFSAKMTTSSQCAGVIGSTATLDGAWSPSLSDPAMMSLITTEDSNPLGTLISFSSSSTVGSTIDTLTFAGNDHGEWDDLIASGKNCIDCSTDGDVQTCSTNVVVDTVFPVSTHDSSYEKGYDVCSSLKMTHTTTVNAGLEVPQFTMSEVSKNSEERYVSALLNGVPSWINADGSACVAAGATCYLKFDVVVTLYDDTTDEAGTATARLEQRRRLDDFALGASNSGNYVYSVSDALSGTDQPGSKAYTQYTLTMRSAAVTMQQDNCKLTNTKFDFSFQPRSCLYASGGNCGAANSAFPGSAHGAGSTTYPQADPDYYEDIDALVTIEIDYQYDVCPDVAALRSTVGAVNELAEEDVIASKSLEAYNTRSSIKHLPTTCVEAGCEADGHTETKATDEGKLFTFGDTITVDFRVDSTDDDADRGLELKTVQLCHHADQGTHDDCDGAETVYNLLTSARAASAYASDSSLDAHTCWESTGTGTDTSILLAGGVTYDTSACNAYCVNLDNSDPQLAGFKRNGGPLADGVAFDMISFQTTALMAMESGATWMMYATAHNFDCDYDGSLRSGPSRRLLSTGETPNLRTVHFRKLLQIAPTGSAATVASSASFQILPAVAVGANAPANTTSAPANTTSAPATSAPAKEEESYTVGYILGGLGGAAALAAAYCLWQQRSSKPTALSYGGDSYQVQRRRSARLQRSRVTYTPVNSYKR